MCSATDANEVVDPVRVTLEVQVQGRSYFRVNFALRTHFPLRSIHRRQPAFSGVSARFMHAL